MSKDQQHNMAYFNPTAAQPRKRVGRAQLAVLEATFNENNKPSSAEREKLAAQADMPIRCVQIWFQNRRAKEKHVAAMAKAREAAEAAGAAAADQVAREGAKDKADEDSSGTPEQLSMTQ
ncbi:hypothetical protein FRC01_010468 [Tulasnella sp. 417]|nr:hypothetical protein FRC01_010468 [Tulasnella sp. 417]